MDNQLQTEIENPTQPKNMNFPESNTDSGRISFSKIKGEITQLTIDIEPSSRGKIEFGLSNDGRMSPQSCTFYWDINNQVD